MAACSPSGEEQHRSLLSAVHFATKMVSATVHVANVSAQQLRERQGLQLGGLRLRERPSVCDLVHHRVGIGRQRGRRRG